MKIRFSKMKSSRAWIRHPQTPLERQEQMEAIERLNPIHFENNCESSYLCVSKRN